MTVNFTPLLGLAQPVTGTESGTWGDTINGSLTALVESSIAGAATKNVTSGDWTLTTTGGGVANEARMAALIVTGTPGVTRNIVAPASSKAYYIINQSNAAVIIKGASTTGISTAAGKTNLVVWNGSDFVEIYPPSPTLVAPALGTPVSGTLTNCTGLPPTGIASTIPVSKGGTGVTTSTGSGNVVLSTSPTLVTPILGTPTSGNLANCTFPTLNQNTTGTAAQATNVTGGVAGAIPYQSNVSTTAFTAAGTAGYFLQSNGTSAPSWTNLSTIYIPATGGTMTGTLTLNGTRTTSVVSSSVTTTDSTSYGILNEVYNTGGSFCYGAYNKIYETGTGSGGSTFCGAYNEALWDAGSLSISSRFYGTYSVGTGVQAYGVWAEGNTKGAGTPGFTLHSYGVYAKATTSNADAIGYGVYITSSGSGTNYGVYSESGKNYFGGLTDFLNTPTVLSATNPPAGGTLGIGIGNGNAVGIYFGSGVPTISAGKGSLYLRTDGSSTSNRMYVNTNGSTGWTNLVTAS